MLDKKIFNFSTIEIFLTFSYCICWLSISTSFYDISNIYQKEKINLNDVVNFLRQFFNIIIFPILIILVSKEYKKVNLKNEIILFSAFLYFLFQIPGLIFTKNSIMNICYIISALNILLIFILVNQYFDTKKYIIFFLITLLMLILIAILNYKAFIFFFQSSRGDGLYLFFKSSETFFGKDSPRSTGSSRSFLFIMIILNLIFYKFFKKNYSIKIIIYILFSTLVLLFQSRTSTTLLLIFILLNYFYEKNFSLKSSIRYFIIYFIMPIILLFSILIFKEVAKGDVSIKGDVSKSFADITSDFKRPMDPISYSSGRYEDWQSILSEMHNSKIIGYGAQGDRFLINRSASNGIVYAVASSGLLGLMFFVLLSIYSFFILFRIFLHIKDLNQKQIKYYYCSIIVLLLLLRSILESSYAVFSVDFIVFYTFVNYLNRFFKKTKNGN